MAEQQSAIDAYLATLRPGDLYPPAVAQARFKQTLINMLRTPPDPKNVRTKMAARRHTAKRKMWSKKGVKAYFKAKGKSSEIERVFSKDMPGNDLLEKVHSIVPRGVCREVRNDLCQEILLAIVKGDLTVDQLTPKVMRKFHYEVYKFRPHTSEDFVDIFKKNLRFTGAGKTREDNYND